MKTPNPTQQIEDLKKGCQCFCYEFQGETINCGMVNVENYDVYYCDNCQSKLSQAQADLETATKFKDELKTKGKTKITPNGESHTYILSEEEIDTIFNEIYGVKK